MANKTKQQRVVEHWMLNPADWVDAFIDFDDTSWAWGNSKGLSTQQRKGFEELGKLIKAKSKAIKNQEMTSEEKEYSEKIGISIMSGKGTGKDCFAALAGLFFLYLFPRCKVPCTAPSAHQLNDILWAEFHKWIRKSKKDKVTGKPILMDKLEVLSDKIFHKSGKKREWFAIARTVNIKDTPDQQAETLSGFHEDFQLFIVDEASAIPDPVFIPIRGTLTGKLNIVLIIFNPTRSKGFAIDSYKDSKRWINLRWNSEESELVPKGFIKSMEEDYGRSSNPYRIEVLGLPPIVDSNTLIPQDWIEDAVERDIEPLPEQAVVKFLDCGAGNDPSIIATRKGGKVYPFKSFNSPRSQDVVDWSANNIEGEEADIMFVDVIGIGHGIYGSLNNWAKKNRRYTKVEAVDSRERKSLNNPQKFFNKRAELHWVMRQAFEDKLISIPNDKELIRELSALKLDDSDRSRGKIKIIGKRDIRKDLGHSPNKADSLAGTFAKKDSLIMKSNKDISEEKSRRKHSSITFKEGWLRI